MENTELLIKKGKNRKYMKLPNGFGSIEFLPGNRRKPYRARITVGWDENGKQIRKTLGYYETWLKAFQALAEYNKNPYDIDAKNITLKELYDKYSKEKFPTITDGTIKNYENWIKKCKNLYDTPFADIKTAHIKEIINNLDEDKYSVKNGIKTLFNQLYKYALENEMPVENRSTYIKTAQKEQDTIVRVVFSENEIAKMWKKYDKIPYLDTVLILIYTGMRVGELLEIKTEDVHIEERYMTGGIKTEAGKHRIIPIHRRILPLVKKWYDGAINKNSKYLIYNSAGGRMDYKNSYYSRWNRMMDEIGFVHTPHDTRHTFETRIDRTPANKTSIKKILGHKIKDITNGVYNHKDLNDLLEAIDYLE